MLSVSNFIKFFLTISCLMHFSTAKACSWPAPEGKTSEWVEDKIVFWGRAVETIWNRSNNSEWPDFDNYTNFEVIEKVKGNVPNKVRVYHSLSGASCGVSFHLG